MSGLAALSLGLPAGQGAVRDPDAAAIMAAMTTPPSAVRAGQIDRLVTALKGCGVWRKLDSLFVFAAHHEQAARIDWKQPTRIATAHGGPVFEPDRGWAFDGVDDYLATGFVPFDHCTQATGTAGCHGVYEWTNLAMGAVQAYGSGTATNRAISLNPRTDIDLCAGRYGASATSAQVTSGDSRGLWMCQRNGAALEYFYRGVSQGSTSPINPGPLLPAVQVVVGANNVNDAIINFRASRATAFLMGALMSEHEHGLVYQSIQDFLASFGSAA